MKKSKVNRGQSGYVESEKKKSLTHTLIATVALATAYFTGFFIYQTNANLLTVVAMLTLLPLAQSLTRYITVSRYYSSDPLVVKVFDEQGLCHLEELILIRQKQTIFVEHILLSPSGLWCLVDKRERVGRSRAKLSSDLEQLLQQIFAGQGMNLTIKAFESLESLQKDYEKTHKFKEQPSADDEQQLATMIELLIRNAM